MATPVPNWDLSRVAWSGGTILVYWNVSIDGFDKTGGNPSIKLSSYSDDIECDRWFFSQYFTAIRIPDAFVPIDPNDVVTISWPDRWMLDLSTWSIGENNFIGGDGCAAVTDHEILNWSGYENYDEIIPPDASTMSMSINLFEGPYYALHLRWSDIAGNFSYNLAAGDQSQRIWYDRNGVYTIELDPNTGLPSSLAGTSEVFAAAFMTRQGLYPSGLYTVRYKGAGTARLAPSTGGLWDETPVATGTSSDGYGYKIFNVSETEDSGLKLYVEAGLTDLEVLLPGTTDEEGGPARSVIYEPYRRVVSGDTFKVARLMGPNHSNDNFCYVTEHLTPEDWIFDAGVVTQISGTALSQTPSSSDFFPSTSTVYEIVHDSGGSDGVLINETDGVFLWTGAYVHFEFTGYLPSSSKYIVEITGSDRFKIGATEVQERVITAVADDGGVYTNESAAALSDDADDMTLLPSVPASGDGYCLGSWNKYKEVRFYVSTPGVGTYTITWKYWNGATWANLSDVIDNTNSFKSSGLNTVSFTAPEDWGRKDQDPARWDNTDIQDRTNLYYVRAEVDGGSVTTAPKGQRAWISAYALGNFKCIVDDWAMSLKRQILFCNELKCDFWYTSKPILRDDALQEIAQYIIDNLDPELDIYFEYGNEVWNSTFLQYHYLRGKAVTNPEFEGDGFGMQIWKQLGVEAYHCHRAVHPVFVAAGRSYYRVLAGQAVNYWGNELAAAQYRIEALKTDEDPGFELPDLFAIGGYFGGFIQPTVQGGEYAGQGPGTHAERKRDYFLMTPDLSDQSPLSPEQVLDLAEADTYFFEHERMAGNYNWIQTFNATYGSDIRLLVYEGGMAFRGAVFIGNQSSSEGGTYTNDDEWTWHVQMMRANRHPRIAKIQLAYLKICRQYGMQTFSQFGEPLPWSMTGYWGVCENLDVPVGPGDGRGGGHDNTIDLDDAVNNESARAWIFHNWAYSAAGRERFRQTAPEVASYTERLKRAKLI